MSRYNERRQSENIKLVDIACIEYTRTHYEHIAAIIKWIEIIINSDSITTESQIAYQRISEAYASDCIAEKAYKDALSTW